MLRETPSSRPSARVAGQALAGREPPGEDRRAQRPVELAVQRAVAVEAEPEHGRTGTRDSSESGSSLGSARPSMLPPMTTPTSLERFFAYVRAFELAYRRPTTGRSSSRTSPPTRAHTVDGGGPFGGRRRAAATRVIAELRDERRARRPPLRRAHPGDARRARDAAATASGCATR